MSESRLVYDTIYIFCVAFDLRITILNTNMTNFLTDLFDPLMESYCKQPLEDRVYQEVKIYFILTKYPVVKPHPQIQLNMIHKPLFWWRSYLLQGIYWVYS